MLEGKTKQSLNLKTAWTWVDIVKFAPKKMVSKWNIPFNWHSGGKHFFLQRCWCVFEPFETRPLGPGPSISALLKKKKHLQTNAGAGKHTCGFCGFLNTHSGKKKNNNEKTSLFFSPFWSAPHQPPEEGRRKKRREKNSTKEEWNGFFFNVYF